MKELEQRIKTLEKNHRKVAKVLVDQQEAFRTWAEVFKRFSKEIRKAQKEKDDKVQHIDYQVEFVSGATPEEVKQKIQALEKKGFFLSQVENGKDEFFSYSTYVLKRPVLLEWNKKKRVSNEKI